MNCFTRHLLFLLSNCLVKGKWMTVEDLGYGSLLKSYDDVAEIKCPAGHAVCTRLFGAF